jgi:Xaa-Pro aminopeptidase
MTSTSEFGTKHAALAAWLEEREAGAVLLVSRPNVAWLACGGELERPDSPVGFLALPDRCLLLCPSDDADRFRQEEVRGLGIEILGYSGLGAEAIATRARALLPAKARGVADREGFGFEVDASCETLRRRMVPEEVERLRRLGRDAAAAIEEVAAECFRGILERDAAARLAAECWRRQIVPRFLLAGADERIETYPRPLPKGGSAEHVLMLSMVASRGGLHVALSRTICLARPEPTFVERFGHLAELAARLRHESRIGDTLGAVVQRALPQPPIHLGTLGGVIGYEYLETEARPNATWKLEPGQALAWSLTATGARCEDTDMLDADGCEMFTCSEDWPRRNFSIGDRTYEIPDLLQI